MKKNFMEKQESWDDFKVNVMKALRRYSDNWEIRQMARDYLKGGK